MQISISINGMRLPGHFDDMIRFHITGYDLKDLMQRKFLWDDDVWALIDHQLFSRHFRSLSPYHQAQFMKVIYDQQPLGERKSKQATVTEAVSIAICPCCLTASESQVHHLRCTSNPSHSDAIKAFQKQLFSKELHAVFYLLAFGIIKWLSGSVPPVSEWDLRGYDSYMLETIRDTLQQQERIGWLSCIKVFSAPPGKIWLHSL